MSKLCLCTGIGFIVLIGCYCEQEKKKIICGTETLNHHPASQLRCSLSNSISDVRRVKRYCKV